MTMVSTLYGNMRVIESDRVVSRSLCVYGEWASDELALLRSLVRAGACVLDVGAFIGTHTLALSKFAGPAGKVYAFEPRREIYAVLAENIAVNGCSNVTALNMGLGEAPRSLKLPAVDLSASDNFGGLALVEGPGNPTSYEVQVSTIDDLDIGKMDLIKLDVEGMERQVLDGAARSILRHRPVIFAECNSIECGAELLEFCREHRYSVFAFLASAFNPDNFNRVRENIFGDSKELMLLMLPAQGQVGQLPSGFSERLCAIHSLEDLVLPLLHKPQYAYEVLAHTGPAASLGTHFPSPVLTPILAAHAEAIAARDRHIVFLEAEIARVKRSVSWRITAPLRLLANGASRLFKRKLDR
jgi:FkbM family methyltransferase